MSPQIRIILSVSPCGDCILLCCNAISPSPHIKQQGRFLSIFYSIGSKPLLIWHKEIHNGSVKRITDNDIRSFVMEITGDNAVSTFIKCPAAPRQVLGITLPYLILVVKNLNDNFSFEVQVSDSKREHRRLRYSSYNTATNIQPFISSMPVCLDDKWNQIQLNLPEITRRNYGTDYMETLYVQIHANCRLRRAYFCDRLYSEQELPDEYKLCSTEETARKYLP